MPDNSHSSSVAVASQGAQVLYDSAGAALNDLTLPPSEAVLIRASIGRDVRCSPTIFQVFLGAALRSARIESALGGSEATEAAHRLTPAVPKSRERHIDDFESVERRAQMSIAGFAAFAAVFRVPPPALLVAANMHTLLSGAAPAEAVERVVQNFLSSAMRSVRRRPSSTDPHAVKAQSKIWKEPTPETVLSFAERAGTALYLLRGENSPTDAWNDLVGVTRRSKAWGPNRLLNAESGKPTTSLNVYRTLVVAHRVSLVETLVRADCLTRKEIEKQPDRPTAQ